MVARRKARTPRVATQPSQNVMSGGVDEDDSVARELARELARLQAMRTDALRWVASIEQRIAALKTRDG